MKPESMDSVFQALAHEHRRRILDIVRDEPGSNVHDVCAYFDTSRIAVMKHLRVLEDAALLTSERDGRSRRFYFNAMPIQMIYDRWTSEYASFWASRIADLKHRVEASPAGPSKTKTTKTSPKARSKATRRRRKKGTSRDD